MEAESETEDEMLLALRMEGEAASQAAQAASGNWKRQRNKRSAGASRRNTALLVPGW